MGASTALAVGWLTVGAPALCAQAVPVVASPGDGLDQRSLLARDAGALRFGKVVWSPDGRYLALTDRDFNGLYLYHTSDRACLKITDAPGSGYICNWSADGQRLGFKLLIPVADGACPLQMPVVFEVRRKELTVLHPAVAKAGVPSFADQGTAAFTIDRELRIVGAGGGLLGTFSLGHYANLAAISPDGSRVAYNDESDRIWALNLEDGRRWPLTAEGCAYFNPVWSPDSRRLVVSTVSGQLWSVDVQTGRNTELDEGSWPSWSSDGTTIFYGKTERVDGVRVLRSGVYCIGHDGRHRTLLTDTASAYATAGGVSPDGLRIAYVSLADGQVYEAPLTRSVSSRARGADSGGYVLGVAARMTDASMSVQAWDGARSAVQVESFAAPTSELLGDVKVVGTVPYLHQVYDTPDDFNGHWACGASSALMAINYYGILPYWDVTCSTPYSHISHYGQYVSRTYTYNGYTYNIGSPDPNGRLAYGGYGYIVRNDWADTKGYMRDYIINHGLGSSVDWSPSFAELQAEVNNNNPFVLLNSLTSAGHYITTIGYVSGQMTAIFNDPYGNKASGYWNYNGVGVKYDWPGYNNGYPNLNKVHCFIYCRGSVAQPPTISQHPTSQSVCPGSNATFSVQVSGGTPTYQWQKNNSNLANGGHYSGVTTSTLTVSAAAAADVANYRCVATNAYGSTTSNSASLALKTVTAITQQPLPQTVEMGGTATFTVTVAGSGTLSYQWRKNGANLTNTSRISGADSATLRITSVEPGDVAGYSCLASAECGSALSNTATLALTGVPGDFDGDDDVDLEDFGLFQQCLSGANVSQEAPACARAHLHGNDSDVDSADLAKFVGCMTAPEVPGDPDCLNP